MKIPVADGKFIKQCTNFHFFILVCIHVILMFAGKAYGDMAFINHDIYPSTPDIEYPGVVASYFNLFQILKCSREPMTCKYF